MHDKVLGHCKRCYTYGLLKLVEVKDCNDNLVAVTLLCDDCIQVIEDDNYSVSLWRD